MKNIYIIISLIIFSCFVQSQIKLNDKIIDSIIIKNSSKCFDFKFDKKTSRVVFSEVTKDEGVVPTKMSVFADDIDGFNKIMNSEKEYDYIIIYNYKFSIYNSVFYNASFTYGTSKYDISSIKTQVDNANSTCSKIRKGKFISPQQAERIAKQNGLENINFQSIDDHYFGLKQGFIKSIEKDVWIFKEEKNEKVRTFVINARNGKVLSDYQQ